MSPFFAIIVAMAVCCGAHVQLGRRPSCASHPKPSGLSLAPAFSWARLTQFIQQQLGVRWPWPGELGTVVPREQEGMILALPRELERRFHYSQPHVRSASSAVGWQQTYSNKAHAKGPGRHAA